MIAQAGTGGTKPQLSRVKIYFSRRQMCSQHSWRLELCTIAKYDNSKGSFRPQWEYLQQEKASDGFKALSFYEVSGSLGNHSSVQMFIYLLD